MGLKRIVPITNIRGLHARASRKVAELALGYEDTIILVRREGEDASRQARVTASICSNGMTAGVHIEAKGPDAEQALDALEALIAAKFHEEE